MGVRLPLLTNRLVMPVSVATFTSRSGRDASALSSRQFIEAELKENPEFFRAFPHL